MVDPAFVQNEACWLGNWWVTQGSTTFRLLLRRSEDFVSPGTATKLGTVYLGDGPHDVNGLFLNNGSALRFFIAPTTAAGAARLPGRHAVRCAPRFLATFTTPPAPAAVCA